MQVGRSYIGPWTLIWWMSEEITSGGSPAASSASAVSNENDPMPWPMSMITPASHARFGRLAQPPPVVDELHRQPREAVRQDVARPQQREHVVDLGRPESDVHHQRQLALVRRLPGAAQRLEAVLADRRASHPHLDPDHEIAVAVGQPAEDVDVEIGEVRELVVVG